MADAVSKVKKLAEKAKGATPPKKTPSKAAAVVQLPIWPDKARGLPNTFARSALFTIGYRRTSRVFFKNNVVAAMGSTVIRYTGEELRQDDETVFLQLLHLARLLPMNEPVRFTSYQFLKAIKWPTSGQNHYNRLLQCLQRLQTNELQVSDGDVRYGKDDNWNSLVAKKKSHTRPDGTRVWAIWIDPEVLNLFQAAAYTHIEWDQRLQLGRPLEQWLHSFYFTHAKPFPLKVETIHSLCGSSTKTMSSFRQKLSAALDALVEVGFLVKWWKDSNGLIHVTRSNKLDELTTDLKDS